MPTLMSLWKAMLTQRCAAPLTMGMLLLGLSPHSCACVVCRCHQDEVNDAVQPDSSLSGTFISKFVLRTSAWHHHGIAVSPSGTFAVVSHVNNTLSVYSLPVGEYVRTFGSEGSGRGQFDMPGKLCFHRSDSVFVAEYNNERIQEVTLAGDHVQFIGVGAIRGSIWGLACCDLYLAVGSRNTTTDGRVMLFNAVSGHLVRAFGEYGAAPGMLMRDCMGMRFCNGNRSVVVAESSEGRKGRLSVFSVLGEFERCVGRSKLKRVTDVEVTPSGEMVCSDAYGSSHRICVFSPSGGLVKEWGGKRSDDPGHFMFPFAIALRDSKLYVLDAASPRVQVFS